MNEDFIGVTTILRVAATHVVVVLLLQEQRSCTLALHDSEGSCLSVCLGVPSVSLLQCRTPPSTLHLYPLEIECNITRLCILAIVECTSDKYPYRIITEHSN